MTFLLTPRLPSIWVWLCNNLHFCPITSPLEFWSFCSGHSFLFPSFIMQISKRTMYSQRPCHRRCGACLMTVIWSAFFHQKGNREGEKGIIILPHHFFFLSPDTKAFICFQSLWYWFVQFIFRHYHQTQLHICIFCIPRNKNKRRISV